LNQASVQQDLDQSPEEPKACVGVESEEGKHRFHLTHMLEMKIMSFTFQHFIDLNCAFKFQELF
jgi:hypothetical protein